MTVLIVQSRIGSTRLPGKALLPLGGKPVLAWVFAAMKKVPADRYFLATDYNSAETLFPVAKECGFECFAGPEDDVLKRFCMLVEETNADTVIRATGDNPFLFYEAAAETAKRFAGKGCDYFTFTGLPHGSGVEAFKGGSLLRAAAQTDSPYDREHVGPALYNHAESFKCVFEPARAEWNFPTLRTTIDTAQDYRRAQFMAQSLKSPAPASEILSACKKAQNRVLLVPCVEKGHGTGHLRRCLDLLPELYADLYIPQGADLEHLGALLSAVPGCALVRTPPERGVYSLIVADSFALEKDAAQKLWQAAPLAALDEGSFNTEYCDYLLDIIPAFQYRREPNLRKAEFIPLPKQRRKPPQKIEKVMVATGGEDPAALTVPAAKAFAALGLAVTAVVAEPEKCESAKGVKYIPRVENLREKLHSYDLIVTHYGFTAFEAVAAGCAVVLLGTTQLHCDLARNFGFALLRREELSPKNAARLLKRLPRLFPDSAEMEGLRNAASSESLAEHIEALAAGTRIGCPICSGAESAEASASADGSANAKAADASAFANGSARARTAEAAEASASTRAGNAKAAKRAAKVGAPDLVVARFENRTIRRCNCCGMLYLSWSAGAKKQYGKSYFFDEYKNQYGKTYIEDFDSIKAQGVRRVSCIEELYLKGRMKRGAGAEGDAPIFPRVLDVGCAYGPFLSAAADAGWSVYGTDISAEAVEYVKTELEFPAVQAAFPDFDAQSAFGLEKFDAVTMWFVIEHFAQLQGVLSKVSQLVPKGGVFAFSTPSASGVSAKFNSRSFFRQSPGDHFSLWQPERCDKILRRFGFRVAKIVSTGQHPERFPYYERHALKRNGVAFKLLSLYSKLGALGDTFEVYCVKM